MTYIKLLYNFPYLCVYHSNGISVFQSGGGTSIATKTKVAKEKVLACGKEVNRLGEVALVSKNPFSLNLFPLSGTVCLYVDNQSISPLPCSNYDKKYHKWHLYVPIDSSLHPEEHPYGAEDSPWCYPPEVSHGVMYKLLMGGSNSALGKGYCGLSRWGGGLKASMCMACCPSH